MKPRFVIGLLLSGASVVLATFGIADINLITGPTDPFPHVTQAEGVSWGHGVTVVVAYTDSSGAGLPSPSFCGVAVSIDGGASFRRLPNKFNEAGPCYGAAAVFYSTRAARWSVHFLSGACLTTGIGQWFSNDGINWTFNGCAASGNSLDRPTTWVDNNPVSPFYGRQYVLFNDRNIGGGAVRLGFSTDDGATWGVPTTVFPTFRRAIKVTGSLGTTGTIYVQMLDEGGGGLNNPRTNFMARSTDGGATFTASAQQGPPFLGPGRAVDINNSYFVGMYTTPIAGYWREMGWGQPAVGPNDVVHYAYSARTAAPADPANVYYIRSTDTGITWTAPLELNTDATTRAQWSPSLAVNAQGIVSVSWYDERNTVDDSLQRFARASTDNGITWGADMPLSDVIFPKPLQPDPNVSSTYAGWYAGAAFSDGGHGSEAYHTWTDGRVPINGNPQQDLFFDKIVFAPPSTFTVTTLDDHDDGTCNAADCTLREAITAANARLGTDVIRFAPGLTGTIQLTGPLPNLSSDITMEGPGADKLTVRRNTGGDYRIFTISDGLGAAGPVVNVSGLTMSNGTVTAGGFPANCGGGIWDDRATLTLTNCAVSSNSAALHGGAIFLYGDSGQASLNIVGSTLSENSVPASGAAILAGAYNGKTVLTLTNTTIDQNTAGQYGGAIYNDGTSNGNAALTLTNCTLNKNTASLGASGIYNDAQNPSTSGVATLRLSNTILRSGDARENLVNDGGTITSGGHNLSNDAAGGPVGIAPGGFLDAAGDTRNTDPQLSTLANNGGPTQTVALLPGSPALNAGDNILAPKLDQRGYLRVGASDIGAFELGGTPLRITSVARLPNGHVVLQGVGVPNSTHTLHFSPDLSFNSFTRLTAIVANASGGITHDDAGAAGITKRFYRLTFP